MGSMSSPNSWPPYYSFKDCSQGICSIYCPQWCYILFPPPPPLSPKYGSGINFSPLIIAIIGILASAFLLVTYYTIIAKYCRRTGNRDQNQVVDFENQVNHDQNQISSSGLDESLIKSITVCKYIKGDGLIEGTECSICLGEFQEDESLKLLPKCNHSFHILCIDTWLKSHSNCPLCRANVISNNPPQNTQNSSNLAISSLQIHRESDLVFVVDVGERENVINVENQEQGEESFGKLISDGSNSCVGNLLVADILRIRDDDEEIEVGIEQISSGIGSSGGIRGEHLMKNGGNEEMDLGRRDELKRCNSTAGPRLWQEKGKNFITPS